MAVHELLESPSLGLLHRLPHPVVDRVYGTAGRFGLLRDARFDPDAFLMAGVASWETAHALGRAVRVSQARTFADLGLLMHGTESSIRRHLDGRVAVRNGRIWEAHAEGPAIFVTAGFACMPIAAFPQGLFPRATFIRGPLSEGCGPLEAKLWAILKKDGASIDQRDPCAARKLVSAMRAGRAVVARIDQFHADMTQVIAPLLDRAAATVAWLPLLSARFGIPLVPMFVFREDPGYVVDFNPPILVRDGDLNRRVIATARLINVALERAIRRHPDQWTVWPSLRPRWDFAAGLDRPGIAA